VNSCSRICQWSCRNTYKSNGCFGWLTGIRNTGHGHPVTEMVRIDIFSVPLKLTLPLCLT